jgi:hypothetical protein
MKFTMFSSAPSGSLASSFFGNSSSLPTRWIAAEKDDKQKELCLYPLLCLSIQRQLVLESSRGSPLLSMNRHHQRMPVSYVLNVPGALSTSRDRQ